MYYKCNTEARSRNHCYYGKAISIKYYECVCSLSNPACNAYALHYIVTCDLSGCTLFATLSHKQQDFRTNVIHH